MLLRKAEKDVAFLKAGILGPPKSGKTYTAALIAAGIATRLGKKRPVAFFDTGAFLARYSVQDRHHQAAAVSWERLEESRRRCFTSNLVLDEAFTLMGRRLSYGFAAQKARSILSSQVLTVLRPDKEEDMEALDLFEKYADQQVSFTDCASFTLMRRARIKRAFSFDRHFERAGFTIWS